MHDIAAGDKAGIIASPTCTNRRGKKAVREGGPRLHQTHLAQMEGIMYHCALDMASKAELWK